MLCSGFKQIQQLVWSGIVLNVSMATKISLFKDLRRLNIFKLEIQSRLMCFTERMRESKKGAEIGSLKMFSDVGILKETKRRELWIKENRLWQIKGRQITLERNKSLSLTLNIVIIETRFSQKCERENRPLVRNFEKNENKYFCLLHVSMTRIINRVGKWTIK